MILVIRFFLPRYIWLAKESPGWALLLLQVAIFLPLLPILPIQVLTNNLL